MIKQGCRLMLSILLVALVGCGDGTAVQTMAGLNTPLQAPTPKATIEGIKIDLLDTSVCAPPCWNGLTPGASTESDVRQFLLAHPSITDCKDSGVPEGTDTWWIDCSDMSFSFQLGEGTLTSIALYPDQIGTLEQVVQRYGDHILVNIVNTSFPELTSTSIRIYFPKQGLFVISDQRDYTFVIRADMQVDEVMYLSSTPFPSEVKRVLWRGFGDYGQDFNPFY